MRVIVSRGGAIRAFASQVFEGKLHVINGELVEPVECLGDQEDAIIAAQRWGARGGCLYKVVMNVEI